MHGTYNTKSANVQQAKLIYNYKNIKEKLHKTSASIWFNKICKTNYCVFRCNKYLFFNKYSLRMAMYLPKHM